MLDVSSFCEGCDCRIGIGLGFDIYILYIYMINPIVLLEVFPTYTLIVHQLIHQDQTGGHF